jgi:hypothetical protein
MSQQGRRQRRQQRAQAPPQIEITKSPEYKSIYTTGVFGGAVPNDCRMIFYQDRMEPAILPGGIPGQMTIGRINRELLVEVHMTPLQFKSFAQWMARHLQTYEERFGEILGPTGEEDKNPLVQ